MVLIEELSILESSFLRQIIRNSVSKEELRIRKFMDIQDKN